MVFSLFFFDDLPSQMPSRLNTEGQRSCALIIRQQDATMPWVKEPGSTVCLVQPSCEAVDGPAYVQAKVGLYSSLHYLGFMVIIS